jgi:hypothetical protein
MRTTTARQFQNTNQSSRIEFTNQAQESRVFPAQHIALQGWKEIATELNRSVRTVQRWERTLGLPIHRLGNGSSCPVFAFKDELQRWLHAQAAEDLNGNGVNSISLAPHEVPPVDGRKAPATLIPKGRSVPTVPPLTSEPEIIKALNAFFALQGEQLETHSCGNCYSPTRFLVGHFWLYGTDKTWQVSVPFCPNCDSAVRALLPSSGPQRIT